MDTLIRLARLEARIDIEGLSSEYCFCCDTRQLQGLVNLFSADAVVSIPAFGAEGRGHSGIAALYEAQLSTIDSSNHWTHDAVIDLQRPGDPTGRIMAHAEVVIAGTAYLAAMQYDDSYCIKDGTWRFRSRVINFLFYAPMTELAQRLPLSECVQTAAGWVGGYRSLPDRPDS